MKAKLRYQITEDAKYKMFMENAEDLTREIVAAILLAIHMSNLDKSKEERQRKVMETFTDIQSVLQMPEICGKPLTGTEVMKFITKEYNIDFETVVPKVEVNEEYKKRMNNTELPSIRI